MSANRVSSKSRNISHKEGSRLRRICRWKKYSINIYLSAYSAAVSVSNYSQLACCAADNTIIIIPRLLYGKKTWHIYNTQVYNFSDINWYKIKFIIWNEISKY